MEGRPREYGSRSNIHRYFQILTNDGFFVRIWAKGLEEYDEKYGLQWDWQSIDGCMTKAPLGGSELVEKNPTDRKKTGLKGVYFQPETVCRFLSPFREQTCMIRSFLK